jgi:hypothetical protein
MDNTSKRASVSGITIAFAVLGVAACGGGGGGGGGGSGGGGGGGGGATPNAPPVVTPLALSTKQNTDIQGQVSATDPTGEALTISVVANPTSGSLVSFSPAGAFVYRPAQGFLGDDTFRVQVTDGGGNTVSGVVSINVHPNRAPVAANDALRADGAALANITVLANDTDADSDPLTVTIEEAPLAGTATVNPDASITIGALPAGFKGVTRFKYRVTDSSSASAVGTAAVFVGVEPFRVVLAGDPAANGSPEVFMSDFVADPTVLTTATEGSLRLRGFKVSENGATVAYRREDQTNAARVDLGFVRTTAPIQRGTVPLPANATLPLDASNKDQFIVSPDGQWIALIARVGSIDAVYVFNVAAPTALTKVSPPNAVFASRLHFSRDSRNLYFLASPVAGGGGKSLYTATPASPSAPAAVSAMSDPATADDVLDYSISANQTSILIHANRAGRQGLFFIDARQLQVETQVSHTLAFGESISASTISLTGGTISDDFGQRVGYTVRTPLLSSRAYVADVSATPNPREIATAAEIVGLRPDDAAVLYVKSGQVYEQDLVAGGEVVVAAGGTAWYDSTGNIVLVQQAQFSGLTPYPILAVTTRGAFGTVQPVGTPAQAARLSEVSGFDRGVTLLAEGAPDAATPARARIALVNALAPDKLLYLGDFESPLQLTSSPARVVAQ